MIKDTDLLKEYLDEHGLNSYPWNSCWLKMPSSLAKTFPSEKTAQSMKKIDFPAVEKKADCQMNKATIYF